MKKQDLTYLMVDQVGEVITNCDTKDIPDHYAIDAKGVRLGKDGMVLQRYWGTKKLYATVPTVPVTGTIVGGYRFYNKDTDGELDIVLTTDALTLSITGTTGNGVNPIVITSAAHGLVTGNTVDITGVLGNTAANGTGWSVTRVSADTFSISATGNGTYISGGTITKTNVTAYTRLYVNDSTLIGANVGTVSDWIELTRTFTAKVADVHSTTSYTIDVSAVKDSLGIAYNSGIFNNDEVKFWICYNTTRSKAVLVTTNTANVLTTANYAGCADVGFVNGDDLTFFRTNWLFNNFEKTYASEWSGAEINLSLGATPHNRWLPVEAQKKVNLALGNTLNPPTMRNLMRIQVNPIKSLFHNGTTYGLTIPANWDCNTLGGLTTHFDSKGSAGTPITTTVSDETVTIENDTNADGTAGAPFMQFVYDVTHNPSAGAIDTHLRFAVTLEFDNYQESDPIYKGYFECPAGNIPAVVINSVSINPATMPKNLTGINFYAAGHSNVTTAVEWLDNDSDYILQYGCPINSANYTNLGVSTAYSGAGVRWDLVPTSQYCYSLVCGTAISLGSGVSYQVGSVFPYPITPGLGYTQDDVLTLVGSGGCTNDATVKVAVIFGVPFLVASVTPGTSGYVVGNYNTTGGTGSGCVVFVDKVSPKYNTSTSGTLAGRLARPTDLNRTLIKPRFITKSARNQAAIHVQDRDESTLMFTCYNGSGAHEDDNIPDIVADSQGNKQILALNGKGIMRGLEVTRDMIAVFRSTEAETFDLQTGAQQLFNIDFLASASLVKSPYGLTWAGRTGIWLMPENGSSVKQINLAWANKYDGSLMIDDGITPYMTDSYRSEIISGYDPYTKAVVFCYQINKHDTGSEYMLASYEFEYKRWSFKVLGGSIQPKFFTQTTKVSGGDSAKLIIGTTGSLLQYPNQGIYFPYTDSEKVDNTIGDGFETDITINIKSLYNQVENAYLVCFLIDQVGASITGTGKFTVEFFANDETTAFDTQYVPIDEIGEMRNIEARGGLDSLRIRLSLPVASLSDFKKWDISRIVLGFKKNVRIGTI